MIPPASASATAAQIDLNRAPGKRGGLELQHNTVEYSVFVLNLSWKADTLINQM